MIQKRWHRLVGKFQWYDPWCLSIDKVKIQVESLKFESMILFRRLDVIVKLYYLVMKSQQGVLYWFCTAWQPRRNLLLSNILLHTFLWVKFYHSWFLWCIGRIWRRLGREGRIMVISRSFFTWFLSSLLLILAAYNINLIVAAIMWISFVCPFFVKFVIVLLVAALMISVPIIRERNFHCFAVVSIFWIVGIHFIMLVFYYYYIYLFFKLSELVN